MCVCLGVYPPGSSARDNSDPIIRKVICTDGGIKKVICASTPVEPLLGLVLGLLRDGRIIIHENST